MKTSYGLIFDAITGDVTAPSRPQAVGGPLRAGCRRHRRPENAFRCRRADRGCARTDEGRVLAARMSGLLDRRVLPGPAPTVDNDSVVLAGRAAHRQRSPGRAAMPKPRRTQQPPEYGPGPAPA